MTPYLIEGAKNFRDNLNEQNHFIEGKVQILNRHLNKVLRVNDVIMESNSESLNSHMPSSKSLMSSMLRGVP